MPSLANTILGSLFVSVAAAQITGVFTNYCPGLQFSNLNEKGCCVGGEYEPPFLSSCSGWPLCQGPTTTTWHSKPISCATIVTLGPDYDNQISSASASLEASGTHFVTTLGTDANAVETATATPGQSSGGSGPTPTAGQESGSETGSTDSNAGPTPTGSGGLAAWHAPMGLAGGAILAAAAAVVF
ncbi:hypothetical protein GGR54DRAFT_645626 [Hypoxylon sp. NC1633]|nr:hypothetical protein GGR54DRAFT_645626 [Hypoxylon sp. NC1633]